MEKTETDLEKLEGRVVSCRRCLRSIDYISRIARVKVRRYLEWNYWGKPLPGFGDPHARLMIIGLAPAVHGGNRTGRMFTGDSSGDWLIRALYEMGFSNQPTSTDRDDGLELMSTYITAAVRCAPPGNKPTRKELDNCSEYLLEEVRLLKKVEVVLTLGRIAFDANMRHLRPRRTGSKLRFQHRASYRLDGIPHLVASYHPSRQNTQTGRLTWEMWMSVFKDIKNLME